MPPDWEVFCEVDEAKLTVLRPHPNMNPNIVNSDFPSPIGEGSAETPIVKNNAGVRSAE
jgi:hypothetical protein